MQVDDLVFGMLQESDFEEILGLGEWYLPGCKDKHVAGEFRFNVNGYSRLITIGNFTNTNDQDYENLGLQVICGRTDSGSEVTLFDCKVKGVTSFTGKESQIKREIVFGDCWIGNISFKSKNEVKFQGISFGVNNLNWWVGDSIFKYDNNSVSQMLAFDATHAISLYEDEYVCVSIIHMPVIKSINPGELKLGIEDHIRVVIHSKIGSMPYYSNEKGPALSDYLDRIYSFLALLIGENPFLYGICGKDEYNKAHLKVRCDITDRARYGGMDSLRVLFPREFLSGVKIQEVVAKFMKVYDKASIGIRYLTGFNVRSQLYAQYTLPEAIYNFEGIEDALCATENEAFEKDLASWVPKKMLEGILGKCNEEEKRFLSLRFKKKAVTLKERFSIVLNELKPVFPYVKGILDEILKCLVEVRNKFSHYGAGDFDDLYLYVALVTFVNYISVSLVLHKCGLSLDVIAACLNKVEGDYLGIKYNFNRCFGEGKPV